MESEEVKPVSEEKVAEAYTEYEKKMAQFKKLDMVNAQLATLTEIEDMVKLSIEDMFSFVDELEAKFVKEIETEHGDQPEQQDGGAPDVDAGPTHHARAAFCEVQNDA